MDIEIKVPRLGWNMEKGTFVAWLKRDGEAVAVGEPLFTIEGDKSAQDIESIDAGVLRIAPDAPEPGGEVDVGAVIGYLVGTGAASASEPKLPVAEVRVPERKEPAVVATRSDEPKASPRARRVAAELGVDWSKATGTGVTGRIREADVRAAAPGPAVESVRRVIADRMMHSLKSTAPVTLTTTADATNLVNLRGQFKLAGTDAPSYTDFLIKLSAAALIEHPAMNARWLGNAIEPGDGVHVSLAVDTDHGLMVPVVRDVPSLSVRQVAARSRELIEKARSRRLGAGDGDGGTFTVSSLGGFGIDAFTPIINWPQCAILGVGRIRREPAVVGDRIEPRDRVTLSLTFDHRIVDGAPAARFLDRLRTMVENPAPFLIG